MKQPKFRGFSIETNNWSIRTLRETNEKAERYEKVIKQTLENMSLGGDKMIKMLRAWDIERKYMQYIHDLYWFEEEGVRDWEGIGHHANYKLMRNTGLKDKDGIEIYESDIIFGESYGEYPLIIKWDDKLTGFYCHDPKGNEDDHLNMQEAVNGKIIGNRYEGFIPIK